MPSQGLRTFYVIAITQAVSRAASLMTSFAIGVWIFSTTGNTTPLLMATESFLTRDHNVHRLRWQLKDAGTPEEREAISGYLERLAAADRGEQVSPAPALDHPHLVLAPQLAVRVEPEEQLLEPLDEQQVERRGSEPRHAAAPRLDPSPVGERVAEAGRGVGEQGIEARGLDLETDVGGVLERPPGHRALPSEPATLRPAAPPALKQP